MSRWHAAHLVLVVLAACGRGSSAAGGVDASMVTVGPAADASPDASLPSSMLTDSASAAPLTSEMFDGVIPPRWRPGDTWEVMFCRRRLSDAKEENRFDTARVIFRVIEPSRFAADTTKITVQERIVPSRLWVRRPQEYDGKKLYPAGQLEYVAPWPARTIVFNRQTFDPILSRIQTQGGISVVYDRINADWSTSDILGCTPHVPRALRNPEIMEAARRVDRRQTTITPTPDGLVFEIQEGDPFISRRVLFWRRGESWWSFVREDTINVDAGTALETNSGASEEGAYAWAVTLPPGQPDSVNCNSKR